MSGREVWWALATACIVTSCGGCESDDSGDETQQPDGSAGDGAADDNSADGDAVDGALPDGATDAGSADVDAAPDAASGPTRFISPTGNDAADGSAQAPWRTFDHAIGQLEAGYTLVLRDGKYALGSTGLPLVSCGPSGARDGAAGAPIVLRAENERRAHLSADGTTPALRLTGCKYWQLDGLHGSSRDVVVSGPPPHIFEVASSEHIVLRRLLANETNRHANAHAVAVNSSSNVLVEESEVYSYHRWGLIAYESDRVTFRRCFANSRKHADIVGGSYASITAERGDFGIGLYQGQLGTRRSLVENCVSEDNGADFRSGRNPIPSGSSEPSPDWNRFLGDIAIGNGSGMVRDVTAGANAGSELGVSYDTLYENVVVVGSGNHGIYLRGGRSFVIQNATITGSGGDGFLADNVHDIVSPSVLLTNVLAFGNGAVGLHVSSDFLASSGEIWSIRYSATNDGFVPSEPIGDDAGNIRFSKSVTPATMGLTGTACVVYVPEEETALKGAGAGGADVGANIVYRYENGVLTNQKLWSSSGFPCGAVVQGVNDVPGSSCRDVHERLNLGPGRCPFP